MRTSTPVKPLLPNVFCSTPVSYTHLSRQFNGPEEEDEKPWVNDDKPQVIVVGFGRFGQVIGRLLMANKMRITVLERDISAVNLMRKYGYKVYYGDATQVDLLQMCIRDRPESIGEIFCTKFQPLHRRFSHVPMRYVPGPLQTGPVRQ